MDGDRGSLSIEFTVTDQTIGFQGIPFTPPTLYLHGNATVELPAATGGTGTVTYSLTNPPTGMTFDPTTRELSGTPTEAGTFPMTYKAEDDTGAVATLMIDIEVKAQLLPATGLDVKPAAGLTLGIPETAKRYALLTWEQSRNLQGTATYTIYAKYPGDPPAGTEVGTTATGKLLIPMDDPNEHGRSLLTEKSLSIWITAEEMGKAASVASETIVIEDTTIISIDGDNGDLPETATTGTATVKWIKPDDVTGYRHKVERTGDGRIRQTPHASQVEIGQDFGPARLRWNRHLSNPVPDQLRDTESQSGQALRRPTQLHEKHRRRRRKSICSTRLLRLPLDTSRRWRRTHSKRASEETATGQGDTNSPSAPGHSQATAGRWRAYIEHALEQWEIATDGLVKMTPALDDTGGNQECADFAQFVDPITTELVQYVIEEQMAGANPNVTEITARARVLVRNFNENAKNAGLLRKARAENPGISEVLMINRPDNRQREIPSGVLGNSGGRRPQTLPQTRSKCKRMRHVLQSAHR